MECKEKPHIEREEVKRSFNRDIVECKEKPHIEREEVKRSFNRDIVECKVFIGNIF